MSLLSAKKKKLKLQFIWSRENWATEDWKTLIWCDESSFLPRHSDSWFKISHRHHESMNESYLVSVIRAAGGVKVQEMFPYSTLSPLIPFTTRLMSIPLWSPCTHLLIYASSRKTHHVPKVIASQNGFLNLTRKSLYSYCIQSHRITVY